MNHFPTLTQPAAYRIRILGRVHDHWSDFMGDLQINMTFHNKTPVTELVGAVPDQPALFGLLCHLRDLGLPLISVEFLGNPGQNKQSNKNIFGHEE